VRAAVPVVHAQPPRPPPHVWTYSHVLGFVAAALGLDPEAAVCRDCLLPPLLPAASTEANAGDARNPGYPPPDGGVIWLHPGSASPAKCWPAHHFARLARLLREAGLKLVWSFGPADTVLASEQSLGMAKEDGLSMDDPPRTLARRLQPAAVYVGADTGVTHLAAAVGCPAVVLFGPTDDRVWRPPGQGGLRVLTRRSVCAAAPGPLCGKDLPPRCARVRSGSAACLSAIPAEDVLNAVLELAGHVVAG
jgi:ADP-heptose:LPS heptosyltransferase